MLPSEMGIIDNISKQRKKLVPFTHTYILYMERLEISLQMRPTPLSG